MFNQITIVGFGLIGSSMARGILAHNLCERLICADQSQAVCDKVAELGLADGVTTDIAAGVEDSDLVILAVPPGAMESAARRIARYLKDGAIVTDTGSVKMAVAKSLELALPAHVHIVPAHPIAGTEQSGPEAGFPELFHGRWTVITPLDSTPMQAVEKVVALWEALGSTIEIMEPAHHDLVLGITSHLPHLIAYTIVGTATDLEGDTKSEVIKFSASGFRDFTRIAASDPVMWRDVFLNNKEAVLELLQRFTEDLTAMQKAIRKGDGDYLHRVFSETRDIRRAIVDAGQADYVYPESRRKGVPPSS